MVALAAGWSAPALAQGPMGGLMQPSVPKNTLPTKLEEIRIDEHLGEIVPLDLVLTNHEGEEVRLGDYFGKGKPVILNLGYYGCPMLCGLVINGLKDSLRNLDWTPGENFEVVTVSIDPEEDWKLAQEKRDGILEDLDRPGAEKGWHFHTASEEEIQRLAKALGFGFAWDPVGKQWAHGAVIMLASPEGKLTRYLYGIEFSPRDLKLGLLDAGKGQVGTTAEKFLLFCFQYDPNAGGYVLFARNMMKLGGAVTMAAVGTLLLVMWRRSPRRES